MHRIQRGVLLVFLGIHALYGCVDSSSRLPKTRKRQDVILISLDTVRRDAVGVYGDGTLDTTPALDIFAQDCVIFDKVYSPIPHTLPSHMSVFTGLYPDVHQVRKRDSQLSQKVPTLGELFSRSGYSTAALVSCDWMNGAFGFARGFDRYTSVTYNVTYADRITTSALRIIDELSQEKEPFFLFLHYYDAHSDWECAQNDGSLTYYSPPSFREDLELPASFCDEEKNCATMYLLAAQQQKRILSAHELELHHELYLRGIRFLDEHLGRLFTGLRTRGLYDDALIVVIADHGEEFREHGKLLHVQTYDESIAVPMLLKLPGNDNAGVRVSGVASLLDVMPSILAVRGLPTPLMIQGTNLLPTIEKRRVDPAAAIISQGQSDPGVSTVCTEDYKLIARRSGSPELYSLAQDPRERSSVASANPRIAERLREHMVEVIHQCSLLRRSIGSLDVPAEQEILSEQELEQLRKLGYTP